MVTELVLAIVSQARRDCGAGHDAAPPTVDFLLVWKPYKKRALKFGHWQEATPLPWAPRCSLAPCEADDDEYGPHPVGSCAHDYLTVLRTHATTPIELAETALRLAA